MWISVKDKLPPLDEYVITINCHAVWESVASQRYCKGDEDDDFYYWDTYEPTHWTPVPVLEEGK